jgi:phytoene synthase
MTARLYDEPMPRGVSDGGVLALPAIVDLATPDAYMARHSRSFRFAAAFMPAAARTRIAHVYAWCRFVDDLADDVGDPASAERLLDDWLERSRAAYDGRASGVALIDVAMREMAARRVPFAHARELVLGVRSDLRFAGYRDLDALLVYAHRVAGVVGQWVTELHGIHDRWMLVRAAALGPAMQLTNIVRDVGEDWDHGRLYLPHTLLLRHGLSVDDVGAMRDGHPIDDRYRSALEDLMHVAERRYAEAREAIPHLPAGFRRAVAVASAVYGGIHDVVRRNDYDNFRRRAVTSASRKLALAAGALLSRAPRTSGRPALHGATG